MEGYRNSDDYETDSSDDYLVVRNHEGQYSIWWQNRDLPAGWEAVGASGSKQECLDYVDEVWTDMRPRSLREHMERSSQT